jgi:8-oxo-dGTP pyrophosphatase MutT (NUDIX family)
VTSVPVRDAATVLVLRDGPDGLEVLMMRRTTEAVFSPGAHVFPGGAVDASDGEGDVETYCVGRDDAGASAALGLPKGGLAFFVAAVRECFEEAGVLLAYGPDGSVIRFDDPAVEERFVAHRRAVHRGERRLVDVCAEESLQLAVDALVPFAHWITPPGQPRRFDTRFFLVRAPEAQVADHDRFETTEVGWFTPTAVMAAEARGELQLILPTLRSLEAMETFACVDDALAAHR